MPDNEDVGVLLRLSNLGGQDWMWKGQIQKISPRGCSREREWKVSGSWVSWPTVPCAENPRLAVTAELGGPWWWWFLGLGFVVYLRLSTPKDGSTTHCSHKLESLLIVLCGLWIRPSCHNPHSDSLFLTEFFEDSKGHDPRTQVHMERLGCAVKKQIVMLQTPVGHIRCVPYTHIWYLMAWEWCSCHCSSSIFTIFGTPYTLCI